MQKNSVLLFLTREQSFLIPDKTITTGVFVDETYDFIMKTSAACNLKAVQLHGNESPELVRDIAEHGIKVIKTLFRKKEPFTNKINLFEDVWAYLVENGLGNLPGGTAEKWNWSLDTGISSNRKIIIAGGLEPCDVAKAIKASGAFGIDVSSGVESSPGTKNLYKVKGFIQQVKKIPSKLKHEIKYKENIL